MRETGKTVARVAGCGLALACVALLGGCGADSGGTGDSTAFAPACPQLHLLPDGADITSFTAQGEDVRNETMAAHITAVPAACERGDNGTVKATMHVSMTVDRGPALPDMVAPVPYFVTILNGENVVERKSYGMNVTFPQNTQVVNVNTPDINMVFPVPKGKTAQIYAIYVSFQLTPAQLAYNRRNPAP